jgi:hypothetical protein
MALVVTYNKTAEQCGGSQRTTANLTDPFVGQMPDRVIAGPQEAPNAYWLENKAPPPSYSPLEPSG